RADQSPGKETSMASTDAKSDGGSATRSAPKSSDAKARLKAASSRYARFVQLQFTDINGHVKIVTIPLHQLGASIEHGTWFDGSSIEGFMRIAESDQYLVPDMSTFAEIPWTSGGAVAGASGLAAARTARVICDVFTPKGEPFAGDPRNVLRRQMARAEALGYRFNTGPELEFFLFRRD